MIRLAVKLLPYAMLVLGVILFFTGLSALFGWGETDFTSANVADLARTGSSERRFLKLTDGVLFWPKLAQYYEEKKGSSDDAGRKTLGYFVPLLTPADAERWAEAISRDAKRPDLSHVLFVRFTPEEFQKLFPDEAREDFKKATTAFAAQGKLADSFAWPDKFKNYLQSSLGMSPDAALLLEYGKKPLAAGDAPGMLVASVLLALGGGFWVRRRRKAARGVSAAPVELTEALAASSR